MGYIVDLSEFNTVTDWAQAKKDLKLAIIRMGYRGSVPGNANCGKIMEDKKYRENLAGVKAQGIPYTLYFFPTCITDEEAVEEAVWIRDRVKGLTLSAPLFLDTENVLTTHKGRADGLSKDKRTHLLRVLTDHLLAEGIPCGIYSYTSWFKNSLDIMKMDPLVIANTWVAQPGTLNYSNPVALWQYGTKKFPWTTGPVDVNKQVEPFTMKAREKEEPVGYYRSVIVSKAASFVGVTEGTAKFREIINTYNSYTSSHSGPWRKYTVKTTDEWCATFVSSIAIMCGYTSIIPIECGCPQMITQAKDMGIWNENDAYKPKPGDIILYDWQDSGSGDNTGNPDHIGIVEKATTTLITVIEGNFNEAVRRRTISVNGKDIRGFICPKYTAAAPSTAKTVTLTITLPEIHPGDRGDHVKLWQWLIGMPANEQDGYYGPESETYTRQWQKKNGKTVDGWVGKGCWTKAFKTRGWM